MLGAIFAAGAHAEQVAANSPKPNVLFIAIDDINPILGCMGNSIIRTPNMDRLAQRGVLFENAHCQWAVCGPSRASLMTGLMPEQTGVMGFKKMRGMSADGARDNPLGVTNVITIAQHFRANGYNTAAVGKINDPRCVGSVNADGTVNEDGRTVDDPPSWSEPFRHPSGTGSTRAYCPERGKNLTLASECKDLPAGGFTDGKIATVGIDLLRVLAASNRPFFLGVGFKKPHLPFLCPKSYWDLYADTDFQTNAFPFAMRNATAYTFNNVHELRNTYYLDVDTNGNAVALSNDVLCAARQVRLLHGYYACISFVDAQVGRVLDELDALGLASNTIVVLWGDHGFHLGDHNEWGKHTTLEQATHMPLIIRAPGYAQNEKTSAPVGLIDLFPTLCELADLPEPIQPPIAGGTQNRPLEGESLVPILTDPAARVQTGIMNHYGSGTYGYAFRTERYRFTQWVNAAGDVVARELYDYLEDPMETVNLAVYPEYDALIYQFAVAARQEADGCERLRSGPAPALPPDRSVAGLRLSGGTNLYWPSVIGQTYDLTCKTNLFDSVWLTNRNGLSECPVEIPHDEARQYFRIEINP